MKKILFILIIITNFLYAQEKKVYTFGKITQKEHTLKIYDRDTTANAVFLFENGEVKFRDTPNRIIISKKHYAKIKIFNKEGVKNATVQIPIYNSKDAKENVIDIRAVTHNGYKTTSLKKENIFTERVNEHWSIVKFTLPNIHEQSIIEYEYVLQSPFHFNFTGWDFQADIPKIYSRFHALIPGNFVYNRTLLGYKKLDVNDAVIKRKCFSVKGYSKMADCEELTYIMKDVPAFIEEDYMTSKNNYLSRIKFELSLANSLDGLTHRYTKSWKNVDKEFRTEKSIGRQLKKVDYIEKRLPKDLFSIKDPLEKAKKTYNFIKNHFTWNKEISLFKNVTVKSAFDKKVGNSTEINIALINALNAVGIHADIVLLSTRENGLPTKRHPVITDFNYGVARIEIDNKQYLLDATNKLLPFGMLPYRALNSYGRVMNFKKGSYWIDIIPKKNNQTRVTFNLKINEEGDFEGIMHKSYDGYAAVNKRENIKLVTKQKYLDDIENVDDRLSIKSYKNSNLETIDVPLKEHFEITIENENEFDGNIVILNPFINDKLKNPFQLKERTYPVDYGYPILLQYTLMLEIPEGYKITSLPENKAFKLPNGGGSYFFSIKEVNHKISMISRFKIAKTFFIPEEYPYLKKFYNQVIKTQKSLITLEKK